MGYDTYCSGTFVLREPYPDCPEIDKKKVDTELHNQFVDTADWADDTNVFIQTGGIHMYSSKELMLFIAKHLNGQFECEGEENGDVYDLIFKDGKIYIQKYTLIKDGPHTEMNESNKEDYFGKD
jgi:hypothetical protein